MASSLKLSYQRLRFLPTENDHENSLEEAEAAEPRGMLFKTSSWVRLGSNRQPQRWQRRRSPRVRVAGLRKIADLFAGNYMFMQVNPSPTLSHLDKSYPYKHGLFPANSARRFMDIPRITS